MVENNRATIENELLRGMLSLPRSKEPDVDLARAVRLLVEVTGATVCYLELGSGDAQEFIVSHHVTGGDVRDGLCRGVIAQTVAEGVIIESASARTDPRFLDLGSVRRNEIEAIVCAPIFAGELRGAVCVQRHGRTGQFSGSEMRVIEYFVQQLVLVAPRLVPITPVHAPLREEIRRLQENLVRDALTRAKGNVARAARELQVARSFVYSVLPVASRPPRSGRSD